MSSNVLPGFGTTYLSGAIGAQSLSIALIGPDMSRRQTVATALAENGRTNVREFETYPSRSEEFRWLLDQSFDVIILDLDSDPEVVLDLVERVNAGNSATVMVYSERADTKLAVRYMRAGAREYLLLPLEDGIVSEALDRVQTARFEKTQPALKKAGNLFVFVCPKGGCGATTVACNLAVALASTPEQKTLLIDFALPIGDAALALGISAQYSTEDAIRNASRLDANLLKELLVKHQSELQVLAAPSSIPGVEGCEEAIDKIVAVARREFDHVIVDIGSRMDLMDTSLFKQASTVFLVTLSGISELRNSNRLISQFFPEGGPNLEVVINRFENRLLGGVREDDVAKALGRPVRWKVPEDQEAAREMQYGATGVGNTRISSLSQEMAAVITGRPAPKEKDKKKGKASGKPAQEEDSGNQILQSFRIPTPAARRSPVIHWSAPAPIAYGDALSSAELNATATVTGTLAYTPPAGTVLPAGTHNLSVSFTPDDSENYTTAKVTVPLEVEKATPLLAWPRLDSISCGTPLGVAQLSASASVPGSFDYDPAPGQALPAGTHKLSVSFTPDDCENYTTAQATAQLKVEKAAPAIAWRKPDPIPSGTPLDARQLCATASVSGRFDYNPAPGEVLPAGTHNLILTFTPADSANYSTAQATVRLEVEKATPLITWPKPAPILSGTPLGASQLNARASAAGTLVYTPALGAVLRAGTHKLSVAFTPADGENCTAAEATVPLEVEKSAPLISWSKPDSISCGTPLGAGQLNAKASVAGALVYKPALGAMLPAGTHTLSVAFTPADSEHYSAAQFTVQLEVGKATPVIAWQKPHPIPYGTPLDASQLCAAASVPGKFSYTPAPGEFLPVGEHQLSASFTPADSRNYLPAQAAVQLEVEKSSPVLAWPKPDSIQYGTPLSTSQLCAAASVAGSFDYSPALGEVLPAGTNKLSATFVPADSANYAPVQTSVSLEVTKANPRIAWPAPRSIQCDTALGDAQFCASSPVPGKFDYTPGPGQALPVGAHTLSVTFTPKDSANYATAVATVSIKVLDKPASAMDWTNPDPKVAQVAHTFSEAFDQADSASHPSSLNPGSPNPGSLIAAKSAAQFDKPAQPEKPAYSDKPAAHAEKPGTHIEWPTPQPMKHGRPMKEEEAPAATPSTFSDSPSLARITAPRVTPFPSDTEKYKAAQAKADNHPEASQNTSKSAAGPRVEEISDTAQKPGTAAQRRQPGDRVIDAQSDIDWLNLHQEISSEQDASQNQLDGALNAGSKKWIFAGVGACALVLASIPVIMHSRAQASTQGTAAQTAVAADYPVSADDSKPSPQRTASHAERTEAGNALTGESGAPLYKADPTRPEPSQPDPSQADQPQTASTPAPSGPSSAQAAMMHDQLSAPSRISRQTQAAANAPPPANFSDAGAGSMGGSGNIGSVFGGQAPSVVAAQHGPLAISAGVAMGLLTQKAAPFYPEIAKKARVSGTVQLEATISKTGRVESVHVVSGPVMLQGAALEAVRSWRYRPYIVNNQPTEVKTSVFVAFSLGQ